MTALLSRILAPISITLDDSDLDFGRREGERRQRENVAKGRVDRFDPRLVGLDPIRNHARAAQIEVAAMRLLHRPRVFAPLGAPDLPPDIDVKGPHRRDADLAHRPEQSPRRRYVLIVGHAPTFTLVGWIYGEQARQDEWWQERKPRRLSAWFVPQDSLCRALDDLLGDET